MIEPTETVQPVLARAERVVTIIAAAGVVLSLIGLVVQPIQFFHSYLSAFLWVFGLSLAGLAMSMVHYLGGGGWGAAIGDVLRSSSALWWLIAIFFLPIVIGSNWIYPWLNPSIAASTIQPTLQQAVQQKGIWYTLPFWTIRAIIYFAIWIVIARYLLRWFARWDETGDVRYRVRLRNLSATGLAILVLTGSFAMFDWIMSLEPAWFSSIYGVMVLVGNSLAGWALSIFVLTRLRFWWPVRAYDNWRRWQDFGSLLLANLILWAYTSFDQMMLIWIGNLNDEIAWYINRMSFGWQYLGMAIIAVQFGVCFFCLVLRGTRRNPVPLGWVTLILVSFRALEAIILTQPDYQPVSILSHWTDLTLIAALGGIWGVFYIRQLRQRLTVVRPAGIVPVHEPAPGRLPGEPALGAE